MRKNFATHLLVALIINCFLAVNLFAFNAPSKQDNICRSRYLNPSLTIKSDSLQQPFTITAGISAAEIFQNTEAAAPDSAPAQIIFESVLSFLSGAAEYFAGIFRIQASAVKNGFTLVEMLIVAAILSVLWAVAAPAVFSPQFQRQMEQQQVISKQEALKTRLQTLVNELTILQQISPIQRSTAEKLLSMMTDVNKYSVKTGQESFYFDQHALAELSSRYPIESLLTTKDNGDARCLLELARHHLRYTESPDENFSGLLFYEDGSVTMVSDVKQSSLEEQTMKYRISLDFHKEKNYTLPGTVGGGFFAFMIEKSIPGGLILGAVTGYVLSEEASIETSAGVADSYFLRYGHDMEKKLIGTLSFQALEQIRRGYYSLPNETLTNFKLQAKALELNPYHYPHNSIVTKQQINQLEYRLKAYPGILSSI